MGPDQSKQRDSGMYVGFVLLACGTAINVFVHKLHEAQPPEFSSDKLTSFEITRVTSGLVVMTPGEDRATEGVLQGNVHSPFVSEDMFIKLPVREL